jgi:hypothetical protein
LTEEYEVDLGSGLRWKKTTAPLFFTSNRCIPFKNIFRSSTVIFCACEATQLFSLVFCVVRVVHIQGNQKVCVKPMITIQKVSNIVQRVVYFLLGYSQVSVV